jgi:predicted pyridoxine 5'-phosphate oxidase superfamily flavin-nucleotide-binding protein
MPRSTAGRITTTAGFVRIIDAHTIGFADFSGNRQYVSVGNLRRDDRVSLFFMDYPNRSRLKVLGRVRLVNDDEPELLAQLEMDDYRAVVERGFLIHIEAFDWNCPQHIISRTRAVANKHRGDSAADLFR